MYSEFFQMLRDPSGIAQGWDAPCRVQPKAIWHKAVPKHQCGVTASANNSKELQPLTLRCQLVNIFPFFWYLSCWKTAMDKHSEDLNLSREKSHFSGKTILVLEQVGINVLCINLDWNYQEI